MKKSISWKAIFFFPLLFLLTACPVSTDYPLGVKGNESIDTDLIGIWTNDFVDAEASKIEFQQGKEKNTYKITVLQQGEMYMADGDEFIGWLTTVKNQRFLVLEQSGKYYAYAVHKINSKELKTFDPTLKAGGIDAVTSTENFQKEIIASMAFSDFLTSEIHWKKQ